MDTIISKKICMVGDFSVGKTSLIRRFVERQFSDKYLSTVGVKISRKTVEFKAIEQQLEFKVQMLIWDLEGNTKFKAVTPMYLQGASSAIIVADVSRQVTVEHISDHVQLFLKVNPKGFVVVALNKSDLMEKEQLLQIVDDLVFPGEERILAAYPTSAKTGKNVDAIFHKLVYRIMASV